MLQIFVPTLYTVSLNKNILTAIEKLCMLLASKVATASLYITKKTKHWNMTPGLNVIKDFHGKLPR